MDLSEQFLIFIVLLMEDDDDVDKDGYYFQQNAVYSKQGNLQPDEREPPL